MAACPENPVAKDSTEPMDGSYNDDPGYNYYGGAEGGLYYAQEFRLSKVEFKTNYCVSPYDVEVLFGPLCKCHPIRRNFDSYPDHDYNSLSITSRMLGIFFTPLTSIFSLLDAGGSAQRSAQSSPTHLR